MFGHTHTGAHTHTYFFHAFLFAPGLALSLFPTTLFPHLPKQMLSSIYLDPLSSLFSCLPVCFLSFLCHFLPQFLLSLSAYWFHFVSQTHRGLRVVPLPVYLLHLNTAPFLLQHFVTKHQSACRRAVTFVALYALECLGLIHRGTPSVFLKAKQEGRLWWVSLLIIWRKELRIDEHKQMSFISLHGVFLMPLDYLNISSVFP